MIDIGPKFYTEPYPPRSMLKFYVKVFRTSFFQTLWWNWFIYGICMKILIGQPFYSVPSLPPARTQGQSHGLRIFMLKFYVKVFRTMLFTNTMMDLVYMVFYMVSWEHGHRLRIFGVFCSAFDGFIFAQFISQSNLNKLCKNICVKILCAYEIWWICFIFYMPLWKMGRIMLRGMVSVRP